VVEGRESWSVCEQEAQAPLWCLGNHAFNNLS
jgi:hypothetical protein